MCRCRRLASPRPRRERETRVQSMAGREGRSKGLCASGVYVRCLILRITINTAKKASKDTLTKSFPPYFSLYFK